MSDNEAIDMITCPRCGALEPDFDGFGMLAHVKPAYTMGCGYCTHPSRDGKFVDGKLRWTCGLCGDVQKDDGASDE